MLLIGRSWTNRFQGQYLPCKITCCAYFTHHTRCYLTDLSHIWRFWAFLLHSVQFIRLSMSEWRASCSFLCLELASVRGNMRNWAGNGTNCQDVLMRLKREVTPGQTHTHAHMLLCGLIVAKERRVLSGGQIIIAHICRRKLWSQRIKFSIDYDLARVRRLKVERAREWKTQFFVYGAQSKSRRRRRW